MPLPERIAVGPEILGGKPVIRGTRLAVEFILELLAAGQSENENLTNYPGLNEPCPCGSGKKYKKCCGA